jgi:hypothetical protein
MVYMDQKSCLTCAWRETCQKRFSSTEDLGMRCPEYTFDLRLKKHTTPNKQDDSEAKVNKKDK